MGDTPEPASQQPPVDEESTQAAVQDPQDPPAPQPPADPGTDDGSGIKPDNTWHG